MAKYKDPDKQAAWVAFSIYNRRYWCFMTTGNSFQGVCMTCGRTYGFDDLQAGHFVSGRSNAVLFSMMFVNPQCAYCNMIMHGALKKYRKALYERYGKEFVDRWELKLKSYAKCARIQYIDFAARAKRYRRLHKELMRNNGFRPLAEILASEDKARYGATKS